MRRYTSSYDDPKSPRARGTSSSRSRALDVGLGGSPVSGGVEERRAVVFPED